MVVVEYAYEDMKKLIDLPRDKMIASLSELGAPSEYEPEVKKIITELTPNRPDWYSMEGLARALRAYHNKEHPKYQTRKSEYMVIVDPSVDKIRPFTVCAIIKGLRMDDQRIRDLVLLQEKLLGTLGRKVKKFGLGLYPLHAISFPVHYTTMKPKDIRYAPLGSDREMSAEQILSEHKKGQQYGHLIKGHDRYPVFTDSRGKVMALIPIVNSAETGRVDMDTKDIFIEVSGTDIHACKAALNILCCTLADMGGAVFEVLMDYGKDRFASPDLEPKEMELSLERVNRILGLRLDEKHVTDLLSRMGFGYRKGAVIIPPYRADVMGEVDIIEDIAIAYGYNNFTPTIPDFFSPGAAARRYEELDNIMRGMGFTETKTFVLTNKEKLGSIGAEEGVIEISNPGTADYTVVRPTLILNMLETFSTNKMKGLPQKFYEVGLVYNKGKTSTRLIFGIMDKKVDFSAFRGYLQTLMAERGLGFTFEKKTGKAFEHDTSCKVISMGKNIGVFGKVDEKVLETKGIGFDVFICELEV
ncbi:MAG: phenylalanine--tRNA ligase subunit beta [Candidatus Micrarchaeia archaeon]